MLSESFVQLRASGGPAASLLAYSATMASNSSSGALRLISPISAASFPLMGSPSMSISFARRKPIISGMRGTPPVACGDPVLDVAVAEPGIIGRDHEIAGQGDIDPHAVGGPADLGDDRGLAVQDVENAVPDSRGLGFPPTRLSSGT
jgi:hypothetical protein